MATSVFVDSAVFLYAVGSDHPLREPCRDLLSAMRSGELTAATSVAVVQEVAHVCARRGGNRAEAREIAEAVANACPVHDIRADDIPLALDLFTRHERLDSHDAFHAALAINRRIEAIVTPDRAFDDVDDLQRLDPREAL